MGSTAPYVGPGSWTLGRGTSARLALAHRTPLTRALMFIGAMLPRAQRAASMSGAVHLDMALSASAATLRVWSDLEDLDIVAATQQPQSALTKVVEDCLSHNREVNRRGHYRPFLEAGLDVRRSA